MTDRHLWKHYLPFKYPGKDKKITRHFSCFVKKIVFSDAGVTTMRSCRQLYVPNFLPKQPTQMHWVKNTFLFVGNLWSLLSCCQGKPQEKNKQKCHGKKDVLRFWCFRSINIIIIYRTSDMLINCIRGFLKYDLILNWIKLNWFVYILMVFALKGWNIGGIFFLKCKKFT